MQSDGQKNDTAEEQRRSLRRVPPTLWQSVSCNRKRGITHATLAQSTKTQVIRLLMPRSESHYETSPKSRRSVRERNSKFKINI